VYTDSKCLSSTKELQVDRINEQTQLRLFDPKVFGHILLFQSLYYAYIIYLLVIQLQCVSDTNNYLRL